MTNNFYSSSSSNPVIRRMSKYNDVMQGEKASFVSVGLKVGYFLAIIVLSVLAFFWLHSSLSGTSGSGETVFSNTEMMIYIAADIIGVISALVAGFVPSTVPVFGTIYTACMGYGLTFTSYLFAAQYRGIVVEALLLTVLIVGVMFLLYQTGIVKIGSKIRGIIYTALLVTLIASVIYFILVLAAPNSALVRVISSVQQGPLGIVFAFLGVLMGAFLVVDDFDYITSIVQNGCSKKYEWYAAYSLIISMIYLYARVLRLLVRILSRKSND
ncbi:MAG: Bax inhibitor-1/YccA family protein [Oscillospiraceae bacterium]